VAACLTVFETPLGSGAVPYAEEAERVDAVLADFATSEIALAVWTGEDLLLSGISHGATAPVIAMARTDLDEGAHWRGTRTTGACFFDGIYDIAAFDELMGTGALGGGTCDAPVSHDRVVGRYYAGEAPEDHSCTNDRCACDPDHAPAMDADTITDVAPEELAPTRWKLIECGSALGACLGDIVPGEPIAALCAGIDAGPDHTCELDAMPDDSHIACAPAGIDRCIDWFAGL
jgi:hypothetical protein